MADASEMPFANDGSFLEMMLKMQGEQPKAEEEKKPTEKEETDFIAAHTFTGSKKNMIFQMGPNGVGYYRDPKAPTPKDSSETAKKRSLVFSWRPLCLSQQQPRSQYRS